MYISAFTVAGFGRLQPQSLEGLSPGLNIFLGNNEAGKTTSLEFFRTMLCGYPDKRLKKVRRFPPLFGTAEGGSLVLREEGPPGDPLSQGITLSRAQDSPLQLAAANGSALDALLLERLFGGVTPGLYHSVYGFSLKELQDIDWLEPGEVRNALYGASFGLGSRAPAQVLNELSAAMEKVFTVRGKKGQPIKEALDNLAGIHDELRRTQKDAPRYDSLNEELQTAEAHLTALREELNGLTQGLRRDEQLLRAWEHWEALQHIERRLALPELASSEFGPNFPVDAAPRLDVCLERLLQARQQESEAKAAQEQVQLALSNLTVQPELAAALPTARALAEQKTGFRAAQENLPGLRAEAQRLAAERDRCLALLGPDWTLERVAAFDLSLFTVEEVARHERELRAAREQFDKADALWANAGEQARLAGVEYRHAQEEAQAAALSGPDADLAALPDERLEQIRSQRAVAGQAAAELPALDEEEKRLSTDLALALTDISPDWTAETLRSAAFDAALDSSFPACADELLRCGEAARTAQVEQRATLQRLEDLENRQERMAARMGPELPPMPELEARARTLADVRRLPTEYSLALERLQRAGLELEQHCAMLPRPRGVAWLLTLGCICLIPALLAAVPPLLEASGLLPGLNALEGLQRSIPLLAPLYEFLLSPPPSRVLTLVLAAALGLSLLWLGRPTLKAAVREDFARRLEELEAQREQAAMALEQAEKQRAQLLREACLPDNDEFSLRTAEVELDRERAERIRQDQLLVQLGECADELEEAAKALARQKELVYAAEQAEASAQAAWKELLARLALPATTDAAQAGRLQDRLRAARQLADRLESCRALLGVHRRNIQRLAELLAPLPAWQAPQSDDHGILLPTADAWLSAARRAQERRVEYERRKAEEMKAAGQLQRFTQAASEAEQKKLDTANSLEATENAWTAWLQNSDLLADAEQGAISTEAVRNALENMEKCLRLEGERNSAEIRALALARTVDELEQPLRALLLALGRDTGQETLPALDNLLTDARGADETQQEHARLCARLEEAGLAVEQRTRTLNMAADSLAELLQQGNSADEDEFRKKAALFAEREELLRRAHDLGSAIQVAAGTDSAASPTTESSSNSIDAARALFASLDKADLEIRVQEAASRLAELRDNENSLLTRRAELRHELNALPTHTRMAELRWQQAGLIADVNAEARHWARLALTKRLVETAKRRFEEERQPDVVRLAGALFGEITGNRWNGLSASLDDARLFVADENGASLSHEQLSRGAQEQLYLALRLAYLQDHALRSRALPLIMDDILVNFDPTRAAHTARVLADFSTGGTEIEQEGAGGTIKTALPGHQILFFTCHPQAADMLHAAAPAAARFVVNDGRIHPA